MKELSFKGVTILVIKLQDGPYQYRREDRKP